MPISFHFGRRGGGRDEPAAGSTTPLATTLPLSLTPSEYIGFSSKLLAVLEMLFKPQNDVIQDYLMLISSLNAL